MINILLKKNTNLYMKGDKFLSVQLDETLENNSWAKIGWAIHNGCAPTSWLGQTKEITSGAFNGYHLQFVDKQSRYERVDGNGYSKGVFMLQELIPTGQVMNSTSTNIGGYASAELRTTIDNLFNDLPSEIKAILCQVKIKSSEGNQSTTITESNNYAFLPSEWEMTGLAEWSVGATEGTPQYDFFKEYSASARIKAPINDVFGAPYWLRSPMIDNNFAFCSIQLSGVCTGLPANYTYDTIRVSFAIAIG